MKNASYFRQNARTALTGKWGIAIIAGIIAGLLCASTYGGSLNLNFNFDFSGFNNESYYEEEVIIPEDTEYSSLEEMFEDVFSDIDPAVWTVLGTVLIVGVVVGLVVGIALFIVGSIVGVGYAKFNMNLVDGKTAEITNLFGYFKNWKKVLLANLLRNVYIFLWSLLCGIPGIIATYSYAMVPYIMAEYPELTASAACKKSKEMMNGYKLDLFVLELSFIGWALLAALTCGIGSIVLKPYMEAAVADFYREISGTRPVPEIDPTIPVYVPEV